MTTETNTPAAEVAVTKGPDAVAKGAYKSRRAASRSTGKRVAKDNAVTEPKAKRTRKPAASKAKAPTKRTATPKDKAPTKAKAGNTFTTVDLAAQHGINAKTLRARIRRNIDKWEPLFKDGEKHVFADNATTRKAVAALLDA